jgi:hypothetical protein
MAQTIASGRIAGASGAVNYRQEWRRPPGQAYISTLQKGSRSPMSFVSGEAPMAAAEWWRRTGQGEWHRTDGEVPLGRGMMKVRGPLPHRGLLQHGCTSILFADIIR